MVPHLRPKLKLRGLHGAARIGSEIKTVHNSRDLEMNLIFMLTESGKILFSKLLGGMGQHRGSVQASYPAVAGSNL